MNKETMNDIYVKYWLDQDDIFDHKHYKIITRQSAGHTLCGACRARKKQILRTYDKSYFESYRVQM